MKYGADDFIVKFGDEEFNSRIDNPIWTLGRVNLDNFDELDYQTVKEIARKAVLLSNFERDNLIASLAKKGGFTRPSLKGLFKEEAKNWYALRPKKEKTHNRQTFYFNDERDSIYEASAKLSEIVKNSGKYYIEEDVGVLCRIQEEKLDRLMDPERLNVALASQVDFKRVTPGNNGDRIKNSLIDSSITKVLIDNSSSLCKEVPRIRSYTKVPVLWKDKLVYRKGYDEQSHIYYDGEDINPSQDLTHLTKLFDFPYVEDHYFANAIGLALSSVVLKDQYCGKSACGLIKADEPAAGKTSLVESIGVLMSGSSAVGKITYGSEAEVRKSVVTKAQHHDLMLTDNVKVGAEELSSQFLEAMITSEEFSDRLLGGNQDFKRRNNMSYFFTMNRGKVSSDLSSRSVAVLLSTKKKTKDFNPVKYATKHRKEILSEIVGMVERWIAKGCPRIPIKCRFPEWASTVNGILQCSGIKGFMFNHNEVKIKLDSYAGLLLEVGATELENSGSFETEPKNATQWLMAAEPLERKIFSGMLPSEKSKKVGRTLSGMVGYTFEHETVNGEKITITVEKMKGKSGGRSVLYKFVLVQSTGPTTGSKLSSSCEQMESNGNQLIPSNTKATLDTYSVPEAKMESMESNSGFSGEKEKKLLSQDCLQEKNQMESNGNQLIPSNIKATSETYSASSAKMESMESISGVSGEKQKKLNLDTSPVTNIISTEVDESWKGPIKGSYQYSFLGKIYPSKWWSGEKIESPILSYDVETEKDNHAQIKHCTAFDGKTILRIEPSRLKDFLEEIASKKLICHNSNFDVINLLRFCNRMDLALKLLGNKQIKDTLALAKLINLSEGYTNKSDLGAVSKRFLGVELPKEVEYKADNWKKGKKVSLCYGEFEDIRQAPAMFLHYNAFDALAPWFLLPKLETTAKNLASQHGVDPEKMLSYDGLVSTMICAGITSSFGMALDKEAVIKKESQLYDGIEEEREILSSYGYDPVIYRLKTAKEKKGREREIVQVRENLNKFLGEKVEGNLGIQDAFSKILAKLEKDNSVKFATNFHAGRKKLVYSQKEEDLRKFKSIPFIASYLRYESLSKIKSTFIDPLVAKDRISSSYSAGKVTGRVGSSNPNLQNIPRSGGIRDLYIAEKGKKLVIADYAGAELQAAGQFCLDNYGQSKLAENLNAGRDVHSEVAARFFKIDESQVTKTQRQYGKIVNFGRLGAGGPGTLQSIAKKDYGVDVQLNEVKDLIKLWDTLFPESKLHFEAANQALRDAWEVDRDGAFKISMVLQGREHEYNISDDEVDWAWGEITRLKAKFPKLAKHSDAIARKITTPELERDMQCTRVSIVRRSGRVRGGCSYTEWCNNACLQSSQADVTNLAWRMLLEENLKIVNVIHDEFICECDEKDAPQIQKKVEEIMLRAAREYYPDMKKIAVESAICDKWEKV